MKLVLVVFSVCFLFLSTGIYCQNKEDKSVESIEKVKEDKSSKYGECVKYKVKFSNGKSGYLWQANSDSKWWSSTGLVDKGPFSKEKAIDWLWKYKNGKGESSDAATIVNSAIMYKASKNIDKNTKIDNLGRKYIIVNGQRQYLK